MSDSPAAGLKSNQTLRVISEGSLDAVIAIDIHGQIVMWNSRATEVFGWTSDEAVGRDMVSLIVPEKYRASLSQGLRSFQTTGSAPIVGRRPKLTALNRSGSEFPIELSVSQLSHSEGTYFVAFVRDLSAWSHRESQQNRRLFEAEFLRSSTVEVARSSSFEESLQSILAAITQQIDWPVGHVWIPSDTGNVVVSSQIWHIDPRFEGAPFRQATEQVRFSKGCGLPGSIWESGKPAWIEDVKKAPHFSRAQPCLESGLRAVFGFPVISSGELQAVLEFYHEEVIPEDAELLSLVERLGTQVGELVSQRRFVQQQARLAAIVDSSYDAIIGKDLGGTITDWNSGAERIYGYAEEEAVGSEITIILPEGQDQEEPEILHAKETGQRLQQFPTTRRRKDGRLIPVELTMSPIVDLDDEIIGWSTIERDFSERHRREAELHAAKEEADRANQARGEFLANVSHELRTPMNAIIGMTQIALEEDLSDEVRDYISTANGAGHALLTILNDILDFSKIESGKFTINKAPFHLAEVIDETVRTISTQAFAKGLELVCEIAPNVPRRVVGDSIRLRQILTNLLSNAIKFTEQGEIILKIKAVRTWPNEVRLRFIVRDTGIGIPKKEQERILEPFTQVDSSSTRRHGGTGLGLAICSELLKMMGGRMSLESEPGKGSAFSFTLSFETNHDPVGDESDGIPLERLQNLPVLVVDDNETNRRILADALKSWSLSPTVAQDAEQALGLYRTALEQGRSFPLVIVDALMPGMDGYELSQRLASTAQTESPPVILMASSTDRHEFKEREEQAKVSVFLQKPVTQSDLMDAVMKALDVQPPKLIEEIGSTSELTDSMTPLSILLAEDTPANQKVVETLLKKRGHAVTLASNGREAVEAFKTGEFDVVLMDVQMPILDGFQATAAIRDFERESGVSVPIIAMTAHAMQGDRERCLEAGMDAYLAKPVDIQKLLELVESIGDGVTQSPTTPPPSGSESADPVLDYEGVMKRLGDDRSLLIEFIGFYDEDSVGLVEGIVRAIETGDGKQLQRSAHSLKGLAANLGATTVVSAAQTLEDMGKNVSLQDADKALDRLRHEMKRLANVLRWYRR